MASAISCDKVKDSRETNEDMKDPVHEFLRKRGSGAHVIRGGLVGLVESWEKTVQSVENGYSLTLDDYLNDLDARQLIAEVWPIAGDDQRAAVAPRLGRADEMMRRATLPTPVCLWGREAAEREGWTPLQNWWYFARPIQADAELLSDIDELIES